MLYGHSHNELPTVGKSIDIGVDGHNFEPWSLEEIEVKMATLPQAHIITNVWPGKELPKQPIDALSQGIGGSTYHNHVAGETCGFCKMDNALDSLTRARDEDQMGNWPVR